jgi:hypothetical protein
MKNQTTTRWEVSVLENSVRLKLGDKYGDMIHEPLQSFAWKSDIAYYHACESKLVIKKALTSTNKISTNDSNSTAITKAIFLSTSPDNENQHILAAQFQSEAHIIASAQAMHSLCDILSVIIYWCSQLDTVSNSPSVNKLNLFSIKKSLKIIQQYSKISNLISTVTTLSEFAYLAAYVNTTKHNSLVSSSLSVSFDSDNISGMRIKEFSYTDFSGKINNYSSKWSHDFLFVDNYALLLKLITVGNSLNDYFK